MKTLFESAHDLDIILLHRASDALAWFVSNNNYQWPWVRWERVLDVRPAPSVCLLRIRAVVLRQPGPCTPGAGVVDASRMHLHMCFANSTCGG